MNRLQSCCIWLLGKQRHIIQMVAVYSVQLLLFRLTNEYIWLQTDNERLDKSNYTPFCVLMYKFVSVDVLPLFSIILTIHAVSIHIVTGYTCMYLYWQISQTGSLLIAYSVLLSAPADDSKTGPQVSCYYI